MPDWFGIGTRSPLPHEADCGLAGTDRAGFTVRSIPRRGQEAGLEGLHVDQRCSWLPASTNSGVLKSRVSVTSAMAASPPSRTIRYE